ncbi:MAG TPA: bifunctional DedA family/phosphatase PAP2 family protein [Longimicrobiales bacterium]|nr:bifunctional DedA family/phosphatase PAP2 family protein [Longimicrobiales bacterium]
MGQTLLHWLTEYGYWGLGLGVLAESAGLPLPGETALLVAAFAASQGRLSLPVVIVVAAVAGTLGDNLGYLLGRRLGRPWLERYGRWVLLTPGRLERADRFFDRFGPAGVMLARFVTGVRVVMAFAAGVGRMPWRTFAPFNVAGAVLWATVVGLLGYYFGRGWQSVAQHLGPAADVMVAIVPLVLASAWLVWYVRNRAFPRMEANPVRGLAWHWVTVLALNLAAVGIFAKIAEDVAERESGAFDHAIRDWVLAHHTPALNAFFGTVTWLGSVPVLGAASIVAVVVLARRRSWRYAAVMALAPLLAGGAILGLKALFARPRPPGAAAHALYGFSFPSGHTTGSTGVLLTFTYVFWRERIAGRWLPAVAIATALLVGLSRVYLDVHWATDVLGGWAVGVFIATWSGAVYERVRTQLA